MCECVRSQTLKKNKRNENKVLVVDTITSIYQCKWVDECVCVHEDILYVQSPIVQYNVCDSVYR